MDSKTFCFQDYDAVGVDLDHTICKYKLDAFFPLIYNCLAKVLVEEHGYSKSLLDPFENDKDFLTKGLVLDVVNGNFLKLSGDGIILRATHGTTRLNNDEIVSYYGKERQWKHFAELKETLKQSEHVRYFENYFDMPAAVLFARLIDLKDKEAGKKLQSYSLSSHMIYALNKVFSREHFADGTGGYFSSVRANPSMYLQPCSEITKQWLRNLRSGGQTVFLKTSSNVDYAVLLLEYILGADWKSYFDVCIMFARKPGFFFKDSEERPFYTIKNFKEDETVTEISSHNCYLQGNIHIFTQYLQKATGKDKPKVIYVGDSIRSDVWPTNIYANWQSVLVLEEMEAEHMTEDKECQPAAADGPPLAKLAKLKGPSQREREYLLSSLWGSFFVDNKPKVSDSQSHDTTDASHHATDASHHATDSSGNKAVLTDSLWGYFVKTFSTIAVPTVEHVAAFPLDHKFKTFSSDDSGTAGFYPSMPCAYKQ